MTRKNKLRKPIVMFCELRRGNDEIINISSQNGAEGVVTQMLPKSHISHVILNANVSEERFLDMKVSTENKMKKKSMDVHDHFINTFIKRLERKQERWMKEDNYVAKNFQIMSSVRRPMSFDFTVGYPKVTGTTPQNTALYRPAKYPYSAVSKRATTRQQEVPPNSNDAQKNEHRVSRMNSTLPQIAPTNDVINRAGQNREPTKEDRSENVKFPNAPQENTSMVGRFVDNTNVPDRFRQRSTSNWHSASHRSYKRRVGFKVHDDRFVSLMSYLSPVLDRNSLRGGSGVLYRMDSAMSKSSSRLLASRS